MAAVALARLVDPPGGSSRVVLRQAERGELGGGEVLPRDGARVALPASSNPVRARGAETAVAVEDENHTRTVALWYAVAVLRLVEPSGTDLDRILAGACREEVTYPEIGATRGGELPVGYRADRYERRLGVGKGSFEKAVAAMLQWETHTGAGVRVHPKDARIAEGETVLFVFDVLGVSVIAPCRVVYVDETVDSFTAAYGSLPGHPERGEVAMTARRDADGVVTGRIVSFSRTIDPLARAALPVTRLVQKRVTARYLEALAAVT